MEKLVKIGEYKDYRYYIIERGFCNTIYYCGYVAIDEDNYFFNKSVKKIEKLNVYGGVTFQGEGTKIKLPLEKFIIGFDTLHGMHEVFEKNKMKELEITEDECKNLIHQINLKNTILKEIRKEKERNGRIKRN